MICPECSPEWSKQSMDSSAPTELVGAGVKDANGNLLNDAGDGDDITCKTEELGSINLKSEYVCEKRENSCSSKTQL